MKTKETEQSRFIYIITTPIRALCRARDIYVRSMSDCASENAVGLQMSTHAASLPRSFSAASSRSAHEDYRELVRAASARTVGSGLDYVSDTKHERKRAAPARSVSVAMGRIDEERPSNCSGGGEDVKIDGGNGGSLKKELKYARSKSQAVMRTPF